MPTAPTVPARRDGHQLVIRCPYCNREHRHGAVGPNRGDGDGHRTAHCGQGRGYFLAEQ